MKKTIFILIAVTFLCQNVGFGASILRPPSHFNKATEEFTNYQADDIFMDILNSARAINPDCDAGLLYDLYKKYETEFKNVIGRITEGCVFYELKESQWFGWTETEGNIGGDLMIWINERRGVIRDVPYLEKLKRLFNLEDAYFENSTHDREGTSTYHEATAESYRALMVSNHANSIRLYYVSGNNYSEFEGFFHKDDKNKQNKILQNDKDEQESRVDKIEEDPKEKVDNKFNIPFYYLSAETPEEIMDITGSAGVTKLVDNTHRQPYRKIIDELRAEGIDCKVYNRTSDHTVEISEPSHRYWWYVEQWFVVPPEKAELVTRFVNFRTTEATISLREFQKLEDEGYKEEKMGRYGRFKNRTGVDISLSGYIKLEQKLDRQVVKLGERHDMFKKGRKDLSFIILNNLELPYPKGIVLSFELIDFIRKGKASEFHFDYIYEKMKSYSLSNYVSVRSDPVISMPGLLKTELSVRVDKEPEKLKEAIKNVADSWYSPEAIQFRKLNEIPEDFNMNIIIQDMVPRFGYDSGEVLTKEWGSGVFTTRDPNSGTAAINGRFIEHSFGNALMTEGHSGKDINAIDTFFDQNKADHFKEYPHSIYWEESDESYFEQIKKAAEKLEAGLGYPQEVEFLIKDKEILFLQVRPMKFTSQGEINYLQEQVRNGKLSTLQVVPRLEELSRRLKGRKLYKVKEGVTGETLFKGTASTSGAMQGVLVFNIEQAKDLLKSQKAVIFVATLETRDSIMDVIFTYPEAGLITTYGNNSSHEAVLARMAGIPSIINAEGISVSGNKLIYQGGVLEEGATIVLDSNHNRVFVSRNDAVELDTIVSDASYGIDILEYRSKFMSQFLSKNGAIKTEITYEILLDLNAKALTIYKKASDTKNEKEIFTANLEKHFLHELLLKCGSESSKTIMETENELLSRVNGALGNNIKPVGDIQTNL